MKKISGKKQISDNKIENNFYLRTELKQSHRTTEITDRDSCSIFCPNIILLIKGFFYMLFCDNVFLSLSNRTENLQVKRPWCPIRYFDSRPSQLQGPRKKSRKK